MPSSSVEKPAFPIALRRYNSQHHQRRSALAYIKLEELILSDAWSLDQVALGNRRARLQLGIPEQVHQLTELPNIEVRRAVSALRLGLMTQQPIGGRNCICIDLDMHRAAPARRVVANLLRRMGYPLKL